MKAWLAGLLLTMLVLAGCTSPHGTKPSPTSTPTDSAPVRSMTLATTTSTKDSGLLDAILPQFEALHRVDVKVVAVGTGRSLELGRSGDADAVLVHAPETERAYLRNGSFTARYETMYNQFLLVGPPSDPAMLANATNVTAAFAALEQRHAPFVSRGDQSGTHIKEQQLWAQAGYDYSHQILSANSTWYFSVGQGMGATLRIAAEKQAYTLSDDGTFYATQPPGLGILRQNEPPLRNQYSVMVINQTRHPSVQGDLAQAFADWMTSASGQAAIGAYEVRGHRLFTPNAGNVEFAVTPGVVIRQP